MTGPMSPRPSSWAGRSRVPSPSPAGAPSACSSTVAPSRRARASTTSWATTPPAPSRPPASPPTTWLPGASTSPPRRPSASTPWSRASVCPTTSGTPTRSPSSCSTAPAAASASRAYRSTCGCRHDRRDGVSSVNGTQLVVDDLEQARERLRAKGRAAMGSRAGADTRPLAELIRGSGASWYPVLALGLLVVVDQFQGYAFFVLGPEISRALGIGRSGLAGLAALKTLAISVAAFPMAAFVQRTPRRALVSIVTGFAWGAMTMLTGFVVNAVGMAAILVGDGASSGSVQAIHQPLLVDSYP